jgi:hypothetical protein
MFKTKKSRLYFLTLLYVTFLSFLVLYFVGLTPFLYAIGYISLFVSGIFVIHSGLTWVEKGE